ncbi:MAG: class I SAM-dependent methyltransferase [Candidatus Nanoarchaeia archaeon]
MSISETKREIEILRGGISDYELLDSGGRQRLERFGPMLIVRHEPKAWWRKTLSAYEWAKCTAEYDINKKWIFTPSYTSYPFVMQHGPLRFEAKISGSSRHLGVFPEQSPHWDFIMSFKDQIELRKGEKPRLLNLFAYTGGASLAGAFAGFETVHLDASKPAIEWAKRNFQLSGLSNKPVRFILDDASKFIRREIRRGRTYDAIILDPPSFGRGPAKELWKAEDSIAELLADCVKLLSNNPLFIILTMYNIEASALTLANLLEDAIGNRQGKLSCGELVLQERASSKFLSLSIFSKIVF